MIGPTFSRSSPGHAIEATITTPPGIIPLGRLQATAQDDPVFNHLAQLAEQVIEDPIVMRRLSERVLEMLHFELRQQHERGQQSNSW